MNTYKPQAGGVFGMAFFVAFVVLIYGMVTTPRPTIVDVACVALVLFGACTVTLLQQIVDHLKKGN